MRDPDRIPLEILDPGRSDPEYWARFRRAVVDRAGFELARRRRRRPVSVSQIVGSWARGLVPAAAAAAVAAILILPAPPATRSADAGLDGIEELLTGELGEPPIPVVLAWEEGEGEPPVDPGVEGF